jgi:hypothetical protein
MSDPRKSYIISSIADVLGSSVDRKQLESQMQTHASVDNFLENSDVTLLAVVTFRADQVGFKEIRGRAVRLRFSDSICITLHWLIHWLIVSVVLLQNRLQIRISNASDSKGGQYEQEVYVIKKVKADLPRDNIEKHVLIASSSDSALLSLYLTLVNVYKPKLAG